MAGRELAEKTKRAWEQEKHRIGGLKPLEASKDDQSITQATKLLASARFDCSKVLLDHSIISGTNYGRYS